MNEGDTTNESASAVLLFPAALLVLLALGLTVIDSAVAFMAQRQLFAVSEAVANEVVAAVDVDRFLAGDGEVALDPDAADERIAALVRGAGDDPLFNDVGCAAPIVHGLEVTVSCTARLRGRLTPGWSPAARSDVSATTTVAGVVR